MAQHEADREDLMAEVTALRERVELALPGETDPVVAGFRNNGGVALYFGADPVFQFDAAGGLRRAFVAGDLYRSQGKTLARLTRRRMDGEVQLVRHDLDPGEMKRFLSTMQRRLEGLWRGLSNGVAQIVRHVPPEGDLRPRLISVLESVRRGGLSSGIKTR